MTISNFFVNGLIFLTVTMAVEAFTEIIVNGDIFQDLRGWISRKSPFYGMLVTCGYCLSVWTSMLFAGSIPFKIVPYVVFDYIIKLLVLHRLSNVVHELIIRLLNRIPKQSVVTNITRFENGLPKV
jgi:hypothetical protein